MKQFSYMWTSVAFLCLTSLAEAALLRRHGASGIANVTSLDSGNVTSLKSIDKRTLFDQPADKGEAEGQVDADTEALEDSIVEMLKSSSNHSGKPKGGKTGLEDGINMMKKMVEDQMMPKVISAHDAAQAQLNSLYAAFTACNSVRSSKMLAIPGLLKAKTASSVQHKKCRKNEDKATKAAGRCGDLLKAKNGAKKAACDALKAVQSDPNKEANTCKSNGENYGQWVKRIKGWIDKKAVAYEKADKRCGDATNTADAQAKTCKPLGTKAKGSKVGCDAIQDTLETATCSVATKAKGACSEYVECFNAAKSALTLQLPAIKKLEANRKAEWRALKRMVCLLGIFADGDAKEKDVDKCKEKTHKTDHLNLKYGTVPRPQTCKSPVPDPCSSSYIAEEYAALPLKARAKDCTMCAGLSSTLPLPAGFNVRCKHDPAWSYVLDYEDDRSKDDIPNNRGVMAQGFSNKNAFYIGNAKLEKLDIEQAEICALSSTTRTKDGQCQYSCKTLSEGNWGNNACVGCKQVSTKVKKIIAAMSGQGHGGNILVNVDPGIASFQPPFGNAKWMCGGNKAPGVYKRIYGWGTGWHAEGWGISMRADHGAGNFEIGWHSAHCGLRAKLDIDSFQIRVKTKARRIASKILSSKDLSKRCAAGYVYKEGDIPGWGAVDGFGSGAGVKNCQECAKACTLRKGKCKSYECSPIENKCNLNAAWDPKPKSKRYKTYDFCMKGPIFSVPQEESYNGNQCRHSADGKKVNIPTGNTPYTIEAWVKPSKGIANGAIVSWGETGSAVWFFIVNPTKLSMHYWRNILSATGLALDDGKYHHVATTWDGSRPMRRIYVDGKMVGSQPVSDKGTRSGANFCVGSTWDRRSLFKGKMKGVKIWDFALSEKQLNRGFAERVACENPKHGTFPSCTLGRTGDCNGRARLGYGNRWTEWKNVKGKFSCTNGFFGKDPAGGQAKECICESGKKAL